MRRILYRINGIEAFNGVPAILVSRPLIGATRGPRGLPRPA